MGHSRAYLDLLEISEREITRRLAETTDYSERYEHNIELQNVAIMREHFMAGIVI
jgi:hypothetical protein